MSETQVIAQAQAGEHLTMEQMATAIDAIMSGCWPEEAIGQLLRALADKGETVDEVAGAAAAMRRHMTAIRSERRPLLDTCGTGGDASGTFNISTAAALVTAAAGVPVAKHGNRSITSKTGSADVLQQLGVNIEATVGQSERCLEELGICFCFAPLFHQSMKHVAHVRRQLKIRTIFNLLGPLCNPAAAEFQLLGVGRPALRNLLAKALMRLGTERATVVCGIDGLDEVTLCTTTECTETTAAGLREFTWSAADFGLAAQVDYAPIQVTGPEQSAAIIRDVLSAKPGPARDIVVANAAAAIWTAGQAPTLNEAVQRGQEAIDSGAAARLLDRLARVSHQRAP